MSMNIPKTTNLTLKRIIENLDNLSSKFSNDTPKLTPDEKRRLQEMASNFENLGECLRNEEAIVTSANAISELCELAQKYAISEGGDMFQEVIITKDMNELKKRVMEFKKIATETYARMQQLGVAYQDIGHVLGRYYNLKQAKSLDQEYSQPKTNLQTEKTPEIAATPLSLPKL